jgi:hypothetical protein
MTAKRLHDRGKATFISTAAGFASSRASLIWPRADYEKAATLMKPDNWLKNGP